MSEDMAQGQQVEEANGVDQALPLQIVFNFLLERRQIRHKITVGNTNAFRLRCRSGGKDDLYDIVMADVSCGIGVG